MNINKRFINRNLDQLTNHMIPYLQEKFYKGYLQLNNNYIYVGALYHRTERLTIMYAGPCKLAHSYSSI